MENVAKANDISKFVSGFGAGKQNWLRLDNTTEVNSFRIPKLHIVPKSLTPKLKFLLHFSKFVNKVVEGFKLTYREELYLVIPPRCILETLNILELTKAGLW